MRRRVNRVTFEYHIRLWDEFRTVLLEKHTMRVKCVHKSTALRQVLNKYPLPYQVELNDIV